MQGATIFNDPQASCRNLFYHAMVKQDDTICHIFFETKTSHGPIAAFCSDDRCHTLVLKPAEQALQLSADDRMVWQRSKEHLDGIQDDALGTNAVDCMPKTNEESLQVVFSRLCDLTAFDLNVIDY